VIGMIMSRLAGVSPVIMPMPRGELLPAR